MLGTNSNQKRGRRGAIVAGLFLLLMPLHLHADATRGQRHPVPVRFLLTFDDGPSAAKTDNPTQSILDKLAHNGVQPGVKALFFVQTRHLNAGGSPVGQALLARMHAQGHVLALHSGSARGHINHTQMPQSELDQSLRDGIADLRDITGQVPQYIRPPYWSYNPQTLQVYQAQQLHMLLDDLAFGDGKVIGFKYNWRIVSKIRTEMQAVHKSIHAGLLPVIGDAIPIIVTMHDTNSITARDLEMYMQLLVDIARDTGLSLATRPFFDSSDAIQQVTQLRAFNSSEPLSAQGFARHSYH